MFKLEQKHLAGASIRLIATTAGNKALTVEWDSTLWEYAESFGDQLACTVCFLNAPCWHI